MKDKPLGFMVIVLLVIVAVGIVGVAQEAEEPVPPASGWTISGGVELFFPRMADLNQQIDFFNQDIREVRSSLESLFDESLTLNGRFSPLTASRGQFARVLYHLTPSFGLGFEAEYLALHHHGKYTITSPDKRVAFAVTLAVPTGGGLAVLCLDSTDLIELGPWSFRFTAGAGYYNATAKMEKQIQLTGIDEFTLRDEADVTVGTSAWGSKLSAVVNHRIADTLILEFSAGWRNLTFQQVAINFNDPADKIDLDFSGLCLSVGIALHF